MGATSIEWCDRTVNPIRARRGDRLGHYCEKVAPECANCYASTLQPRFGLPTFDKARGVVEPLFDPGQLRQVLRRRTPTKWFWCDMTDLFGAWVPDGWIDQCVATMAATPWHTHIVVTKRASRMRGYFSDTSHGGPGQADVCTRVANALEALGVDRAPADVRKAWPLSNLWLLVSAGTQKLADEQIPELLATPAAVRGVSAEPLLEAVDVSHYLRPEGMAGQCIDIDGFWWHQPGSCPHCRPGLNWLIAGGESGRGRAPRPLHPFWVRWLRDQAFDAGVAFLFKQWGAWTPGVNVERRRGVVDTATLWDGRWRFGREDLARADGHVDDEPDVYRVGKKAAGRLLDGVIHHAFPVARSMAGGARA